MLKNKFLRIKKTIKLLNCNFQPSIKNYIDTENFKTDKSISTSKDNLIDKNNSWHFFLKKIEKEFDENPNSFLRCKNISKTIHPNQQLKSNILFKEMTNDPFSKKFILPFLNETAFGDPFISEKFRFASPISIQHAYYIYSIQKYFRIFLPRSNVNFIVDFGGGYGNLCKIIHQLGYSGKYNIIDFEIMHKIQKKFIMHNLQKEIYKNLDLNYFKSMDELNNLNNYENSLFIATYSLSETSKKVRYKIENILHKFKYLFIIYQSYFDEIDNKKYFNYLEKKLEKKGFVKNIFLEKINSNLFIYEKITGNKS